MSNEWTALEKYVWGEHKASCVLENMESGQYVCNCGKQKASDELIAMTKHIAALESVLKIYANENNWKSFNGVMSFQTLSNPWGDAQAALKASKP